MSLLTGLRRLSRTLRMSRAQVEWASRIVFGAVAWLRHGRVRKRMGPRPGPVIVTGFHRSVIGIGEGARVLSAALRGAGMEVIDWDVTTLFGQEAVLDGAAETQPPLCGSAMIIHLNPHELIRLVGMTGPRPFTDRFCIGYWAWELEQIPQSWQPAFRYVDEVWTPSRFVADAVRRRAPKGLPVRVLPHPAPPSRGQSDRDGFSIAPETVVVLNVVDIRSGYSRKNPIAAIRAFRAAQALTSVKAQLICKISGAEVAPGLCAMLKVEIGEADDVRLMTDWLSAERMADLIASADIILSMHRSEGFGLVLAQAMLSAKPVVATGWSGNLDFMNTHNSVLVEYALTPVRDPQGFYGEGDWAEADIDDASRKLADLISDPAARLALGCKAEDSATGQLDSITVAAQARRWLNVAEAERD
jgi:glycosyltransferase involved in cell wall biosynthesis